MRHGSLRRCWKTLKGAQGIRNDHVAHSIYADRIVLSQVRIRVQHVTLRGIGVSHQCHQVGFLLA